MSLRRTSVFTTSPVACTSRSATASPLITPEHEIDRFASALEDVLGDAEEHLFRSYASLGLELGRRSLAAR